MKKVAFIKLGLYVHIHLGTTIHATRRSVGKGSTLLKIKFKKNTNKEKKSQLSPLKNKVQTSCGLISISFEADIY